MASILRFVDSDLATVRLNLDWLEDATELNLPAHSKQWSESPNADGRKYINGHWTGRTLKLALSVKSISKDALYADLRALIAELSRQNILEFYPDGGDPVFIKTYIMDSASIGGLETDYYLAAKTLMPLMIDLPADPFWFGAEETLIAVHNDVPGGNFETYAGSGNTTDWPDWVETRTNGAGTATVEALAAAKVFGAVGCHLKTTSNDGVAKITSAAFIAVDPTKHRHLSFNGYRVSGADSLKCIIKQYNGAGADLGDDITITPAGAAAWRLYPTVIHEAGAGGNDFHASCAKIKLIYTVDTSTADWYIDGVVFTPSQYLSGNEVTNALGIVLPPVDILGDVPTPCDIYLDKFDSTVENTAAIYIGGRQAYDAGFVARLENTLGTAALSNLASGGTYRTQVIPGELCLNNDFETVTGIPQSNTETWDNWTATRPASAHLIVYGNVYSGSYCIIAYSGTNGVLVTPDILSDYIAVNIALDHVFSLWHIIFQYGWGRLTGQLDCYDAGNNFLGTIGYFYTDTDQRSWKQLTISCPAAMFPATTTKVRIKITARSKGQGGKADYVLFDLVSFQQTTSVLSALAKDYSDHLKGFVVPFLHYKVSSAVNKTLSLQAKLADSGLGDITTYAEKELKTVSMPVTWTYQPFKFIKIPSSPGAESMDTATLEQCLQIQFDPSLTGEGTVSIDDLALIPSDNGSAVIPSESNRHLILDSNSAYLAVLVSIDGDIDKAVILEAPGALRKAFTLDPQNGTNIGALMDFRDASGNAVGQWLADVTLRYRPRYLVVK